MVKVNMPSSTRVLLTKNIHIWWLIHLKFMMKLNYDYFFIIQIIIIMQIIYIITIYIVHYFSVCLLKSISTMSKYLIINSQNFEKIVGSG